MITGPDNRPLTGVNLELAKTPLSARMAPMSGGLLEASAVASDIGTLGAQIARLVHRQSTIANLAQAKAVIARLRAEIDKLEPVL